MRLDAFTSSSNPKFPKITKRTSKKKQGSAYRLYRLDKCSREKTSLFKKWGPFSKCSTSQPIAQTYWHCLGTSWLWTMRERTSSTLLSRVSMGKVSPHRFSSFLQKELAATLQNSPQSKRTVSTTIRSGSTCKNSCSTTFTPWTAPGSALSRKKTTWLTTARPTLMTTWTILSCTCRRCTATRPQQSRGRPKRSSQTGRTKPGASGACSKAFSCRIHSAASATECTSAKIINTIKTKFQSGWK